MMHREMKDCAKQGTRENGAFDNAKGEITFSFVKRQQDVSQETFFDDRMRDYMNFSLPHHHAQRSLGMQKCGPIDMQVRNN